MFETLGHYKILDRIGAGRMGEMFRARDTRSGRTVRVTVIPSEIADDPDCRAQFLQDAHAAARLSHPNIATLYEAGEDQDHLFVVSEYVPGATLKNTIAGRPLNPRRAIDLGVQISDAVADAHAAGLLHRDIASNTIIVTPKGNAKVLDFGLARWTAGDPTAYSSPEEAPGHPVDYRTDIFSLGVVMFEMLTGRLPFAATSSLPAPAPAPTPSSVNRLLPSELDPIVSKAVAASVADRYQSAATLAAELRSVGAILDVRSDAQQAAASLAAAPSGRSSVGRWFALLALLAALGALAWYERADIQRLWRRTFGSTPAAVVVVMVPFDIEPNSALQQARELRPVDVRA